MIRFLAFTFMYLVCWLPMLAYGYLVVPILAASGPNGWMIGFLVWIVVSLICLYSTRQTRILLSEH